MQQRDQASRMIIVFVGLFLLDFCKHALLICIGSSQPWLDSRHYWDMGTLVASGDLLMLGDDTVHRTPLYPWILGGCQAVWGSKAFIAVIILQHLFSLATNAITTWCSWKLTRSKWLTFATYLILIFSTSRSRFANFILTETTASFFLMLLVAVLVGVIAGQRQPKKAIGFIWLFVGGLLGLNILVRPAGFAIVPAVMIAASVGLTHRKVLTWGLRMATVFLVAGLMLLPWVYRNGVVADDYALSRFTGRELWTSTFSPWPGAGLPFPEELRFDGALVADQVGPLDSFNWRNNWIMSPRIKERLHLNEAQVDRIMAQGAMLAIRREPVQWGKCAFARSLTFWYCWDWPFPPGENADNAWENQTQIPVTAVGLRMHEALAFAPENNRFSSVFMHGIVIACCPLLLFRERRGLSSWVLISILATYTILTALLEIPLYRYRCTLEPIMVLVVIVTISRTFIATEAQQTSAA